MKKRPGDRGTDTKRAELAAAQAGDPDAFRELTATYSRELHVHCYRMLGSFADAEDGVQETLLRAWRHLATFESRSSFRAWLYRIATNVCLRQRPRRRTDPPVVPRAIEAITQSTAPAIDLSHLSPYPDVLLDELSGESRAKPWGELQATSGDPVAEYDLRESVQLAFLAVLQWLPPRQRAVLILHDVVGFSAAEVAEFLGSTIASVNSALNRARATMEQQRAAGRLHRRRGVRTDEVTESFVGRCVEAWHAADMGKLAGLLRSDVVMGVPALRLRVTGCEAVSEFLAHVPSRQKRDEVRFIPTRANRQPALAVYGLDPGSDGRTYRAWAIVVLTADGDAVAGITGFMDPTLMPVFGLPIELEHDSGVGL